MSLKVTPSKTMSATALADKISSPAVDATSEELVSTPAGLIAKSNVHAVPEGARVNHTSTHVEIIAADGSIIHSAPVSTNTQSPGDPTALRALNTGNAAWTYWTNSNASHIGTFSTTWTVPPIPEKKQGSILLFNGLSPSSASTILQPILQFGSTGAGGGEYWAIVSWYFGYSHAYHGQLVQVMPGQSITGVMTLKNSFSSGSETTYNWNAMFSMLPSTSLNVSISEVLIYAFEALQIYYVHDSSALPAGPTIMSNINLALVDGTHPSAIDWSAAMDSSEGFGVEILSNSSTNGAVKIIYSDSVNV